MCKWIIFTCSFKLNCRIRTSCWYFPPLYHNHHRINRRPSYFLLEILNAFQNTILPNPEEIVFLSLTYIQLEWSKRKSPKHPLASRYQKELCIKAIKSIQGKKPSGKFWYELLKSIFVTVKVIRSSSDHDLFSLI